MPPFLQFIIRRLLSMLVSLVIITMVLYAGVMLTPPEARAMLYVSREDRATENIINAIVEQHHLDEPYLVQYGYWVGSLFDGTWGYSPTLKDNVLPSLLRRTPATLELGLLSLLVLVPVALISGLLAGWRPGRRFDSLFRSVAFFGTTMPPFIFSMILLAVFYIKLGWFAPGRLDVTTELELARTSFNNFTGALIIDGVLNGRYDISVTALRHLAMPALTLSLFHWATLARVTRASILRERGKEYIISARARGVNERRLLWRHAFRPVLAPSLTTLALSAAGIMTGIFVVEIIFDLSGISEVIVTSMRSTPDAPAALGFALYSVLVVNLLMFLFDVLQALIDPRVREEALNA